ncbi:hypothetical protein [Pseudomonas costantinii]|uniref:hypothetical protein n=1 Tax=Pseudomonas costantinii TaxID=168469 RepID=UPI00159FF45D|nr:hypothetical protein [Pseudomonas costantinii]NVZ70444.1 hypothetical protein [Pseudomonas costantinii]
MKRQTLAVLCVSLIGLVVLSNMKSWVNATGATEYQQAQALRPLIDCLNRVDSNWRVAYDNYRQRSPRANAPGLESIEGQQHNQSPRLSQFDYNDKRPGLCLLNATQTTALRQSLPELAGIQLRYANQLVRVYMATEKFDFYPDSTLPALNAADRAASDARFFPLAQALLDVSDELRTAVDQADRRMRLEQLKQLQARGKHQLARVPELILKTRDTQQSLNPNHLEPQQLANAFGYLQSAWASGRYTLRPDQAKPDPDAQRIWKHVEQPGNDYLQALQQLALHVNEPAKTAVDYAETQRRLDLLVDAYNQAVRRDY